MKMALITLIVLAASFAQAMVSGDKILFQRDSTYVSAVYNKTLCLDGQTYRAVIAKCVSYSGGDNDRCLRTAKVQASQPMHSTRKLCAETRGHGESCVRYKNVAFTQSPVRTVQFHDGDNNRVTKTVRVTIPACN